jgi:hypothetical protein
MSSTDQLAEEIATLAAHLDAATGRLLSCIRVFDQEGGWERQGAVSCAHWLSWRIGVDLPTAREKVRVARALGSLPGIEAALARGELSYAKIRALTRAATPENEQQLLELARHATGAQLERICRDYRRVAASLMDEGPLTEERSVRERLLRGGMVRLELVLHPDEAALVREALEKACVLLRRGARDGSARAADSGQQPAAETRNSNCVALACPEAADGLDMDGPDRAHPAASMVPDDRSTGSTAAGCAAYHASAETRVSLADGAVHLAESFLADAEETAARPGNGGERYQIFVHLDEDVLAEGTDWAATLDDGTRLPAETLRRIACDCGLVATRTDAAGSVLDVGRRTRSIPPALRRALWLRDRGCRFPGCGHTRFLHGHHVRHWLGGGPTSLDNLVLLCSRHHRLLHEGGFRIERVAPDDSLLFLRGDGNSVPAVPPAQLVESTQADLRAWAAEHDLEIGPDTNLPWWDGATPDYDQINRSLFA